MNTTPLDEFRKISAVPRRSYYLDKIITYCLEYAKELGFETYYDEKNKNVLIRKDASIGKEDCPGIVLQGHLDMVAQTDEGIVHDWDNEGIELIEDGDIITANGTTLGADDGVAFALAFALLQDEDFKHPPLEVLLTTNEEVGMDSVKDADLSFLKGKYLINLDGGRDTGFVIGCCGGKLLKVFVPDEREEMQGAVYSIAVSGLHGGHSGIEIGAERANALKVMGRVLSDVSKEFDFKIAEITAEGKDNAICKAASCTLVFTNLTAGEDLKNLVRKTEVKLRSIFRLTDPDISVCIKEMGKKSISVLTGERTENLVFLLLNLPFGVLHHDQSLDGSIETSCNPGLIEKTEDGYGIVVSIRSSVEERMEEVTEQVKSLSRICGVRAAEDGKAYPAWLPDPDSPLIPLFHDMYVRMYGKVPSIRPVHAGLECGYILKNSNLEAAISAGPKISGEHTTKETLSISSLNRMYEFLKAVIESV